ncbi:MAG: hypothetical protein IIW19_01750, partial [Clostridia bacterium]|nr:hypothetical protein [Clostridia bacterium]
MDLSDRQRTQAKPPMPPHPDTFRSPEPPRDSMEAVFPRSAAEVKTARRAQKNDVNFELGSIFVDLDDHKPQAQKTHRPLPPEVPLPVSGGQGGQRPAANRPQGAPPSNSQRPAPSGTGRSTGSSSDPMRNGAKPTAARPNGVSGQGSTISVRPATAPAGVNPANRERTQGQKGNKTVFVPLEKDKNQEFGLSNEEFEQREASVQTLSRAAGTRSAEKKPSNNGNGKAAPQKDEKAKAAKTSSDASAATASAEKPYIFPPISYLHPSEPMTAENESEIEANRNKLAATLEDFNVRDTRIAYSCGPTVTRYEIYPPSGVRVRTITNLADDIALSFAVSSVRMEAIPGKSAIGVEVPNITRQTVYLRDLLESQAFVEKPSRLTAGLGADVAGTPLLFDIAKMPHLLVAGATGMGKSVCINCIIMSILFKARPDEVKLVLIDPKKVEFSLYKGIPHLMAPVIVTPKDVRLIMIDPKKVEFSIYKNIPHLMA